VYGSQRSFEFKAGYGWLQKVNEWRRTRHHNQTKHKMKQKLIYHVDKREIEQFSSLVPIKQLPLASPEPGSQRAEIFGVKRQNDCNLYLTTEEVIGPFKKISKISVRGQLPVFLLVVGVTRPLHAPGCYTLMKIIFQNICLHGLSVLYMRVLEKFYLKWNKWSNNEKLWHWLGPLLSAA